MMTSVVAFLFLVNFAPCVLGARWKDATELKLPKIRRLQDNPGDMTPEQMKAMLEPMMKDCEAKCPGIVDGMVVYMGVMKEMGTDMVGAIKKFCPEMSKLECYQKNMDVCKMGEDDTGGDQEFTGMATCLCSNEKIVDMMGAIMALQMKKDAGVCKDAPTMEDGELDLCKLSTDGPKACADMLAGGYTGVVAEKDGKCKDLYKQMEMKDDEQKCVDTMVTAATTTTTAKPADADIDSARSVLGVPSGVAVLAFAAVQLLMVQKS